MAKITLENICKKYNETTIIDNFNLTIEDGSFTILVGPSGCGKTTILRIIAGLEKPTQGNIYINDINIIDHSPGDRDVAMVFQNYALYPTMTVKENIEFGLINNKIPKTERNQLINEVIEIVDLGDHLNKKPNALSGGQQQRVALARAIVKKPKVFLMDEPLSNLDASLRAQMRSELVELHNHLKTTFVFVTHDQMEALSMSTKLVLINKGEIVQEDTPMNIYSNPQNIFTASFIGTPSMNIVEVEKLDNSFTNKLIKYVGFRPQHCEINKSDYNQVVNNSDIIKLNGKILTNELLGNERTYRIETEIGKVTANVDINYDIEVDSEVAIYVKHSDMYFFDSDGLRVIA